MSHLPQGWEAAKLSELADFEMGQAPPGSACNTDGIGTVFVKAGEFGSKYPVLREWTTQPLRFACQGDVLICVVGATAGKLNLGIDCAIGRSVAAIRPRTVELQSCIYNQLRQQVMSLRADSTGSAQGVISKQLLADIRVVVPPLAEQKRIADKLDTVLTSVDAVNERLARVAPILKRFRQSILAAATSGRLTEDWRIEHAAVDWLPRTVDSLCLHISDGPFGSNLKSDDYTEVGARVVRLENIGHLSFDATKQTFISIEKYETLRKHTLMHGDLLFSSFVDEEVRVCEFPADITEPTINKADCFCVRANPEQVNRRFLAMRLACKSTYEELKDLVHGATRPRINLRQLRGFEVMLPSPAEQTEIVRRVDTLFAFADRLEARLQGAQTAADRLTPSLLAKAFRGELVPQDPNDEPASELLKRLVAAAPASKGKRGRAKASKAA